MGWPDYAADTGEIIQEKGKAGQPCVQNCLLQTYRGEPGYWLYMEAVQNA